MEKINIEEILEKDVLKEVRKSKNKERNFLIGCLATSTLALILTIIKGAK